jgi:hypothetical protein
VEIASSTGDLLAAGIAPQGIGLDGQPLDLF